MVKQNSKFDSEENIFSFFISKYFPFWPLFLVLIFVGLIGATSYLYFVSPQYEATATIIIKDQQKGVDVSRIVESMSMFSSNKIVENEIRVLQSRDLTKEVVRELYLYAPIFEKDNLKSSSAYNSSPIRLKVKDPDKLFILKEATDKIYFSVDTLQKVVSIKDASYPLDKWVRTPYGTLMFIKNENKKIDSQHQLYFTLNNPKIIINDILDNLNVMSADKLSTVINISFKDPVPDRAEGILNYLIYAYNNATIEESNRLAANTLSFINGRMKDVEADLDSVEAQVQQYRSKEGVVDLSEQGRIYLKNVGDNDRRIGDIKLQLAVLNRIKKYVVSKDENSGIVPSTLGVDDSFLSNLLKQLYDAEIEYDKLKRTVAENNPKLLGIKNEIEKIRPSIIENVESQQVNLQASLQNLSGTNDGYNSALQTIPQKERTLLEINRKKAVINQQYIYLLQKREETALSFSPKVAESRVLDLAESTVLPVSPKPILIYLIALIAAIGIGIVYIYGKEEFNQKILFRSEIEKMIDEPVMAEIWSIDNIGKDANTVGVDYQFLVNQFRNLNVAIGVFRHDLSIKKMLITSSIQGEGKSFISKNIAVSLASMGKKVVLMDFDLRSRNISKMFNLSDEFGITDFLANSLEAENTIHPTDYRNLNVAPAGKEIPDASNLLISNKLPDLFTHLEKEFDCIILDTPPVELFSDAYLLAQYCDTTLYIIRHAHTPKSIIKKFDQNVERKLFNDLRIVFNGVKSRGVSKRLKYYGYGYANNVQ